MKLKRVTAVLLAGVMAMGLVACGSGSDTAADTTTSTSTATDTAGVNTYCLHLRTDRKS